MNHCQIVPSTEIDPNKWDACVTLNANGLIYAQYQYLNILCKNWSGLIIGNYETILPLPWKIKWGIRYYFAPAFIQQLGLIGNQELISIDLLKQMLRGFARYGDLFWNDQNEQIAASLGAKEKTNFVINLNHSYEKIYKDYSNGLIQNIQKAFKNGLVYTHAESPDNAIAWYHAQYGARIKRLSTVDFRNFNTICHQNNNNIRCIIREAKHPNSKQILATAILLKDNKRVYLMVNAISKLGRKLSANHFLIDSILKEFSEQCLLFDFEGSELAGVSEFYQNFQPINLPYYHTVHNTFPKGIKWLIQYFH